MKTIRVVAAITKAVNENGETIIFATQRGYGDLKGGWEFPGGKIEEGETPQEALVREIKEELNVEILVGDYIKTVEYDYPEFHLSMKCCVIRRDTMRVYQMKCPACGGDIEIDENRDFCFCSYCGTKVHVDDGTHRVEITKNINYHKTYTDEAKIRKIESEERLQERKFAAEQEERKNKKWKTLGLVLVVLACVIGYFVLFNGYFDSEKAASDRQEQELQAIVDEVMQDIEDGNFDEAYIKAEKIRYTENWSSEIEDKWDATRKEIIEQIEKAEKKANKEENGNTWWNPFD